MSPPQQKTGLTRRTSSSTLICNTFQSQKVSARFLLGEKGIKLNVDLINTRGKMQHAMKPLPTVEVNCESCKSRSFPLDANLSQPAFAKPFAVPFAGSDCPRKRVLVFLPRRQRFSGSQHHFVVCEITMILQSLNDSSVPSFFSFLHSDQSFTRPEVSRVKYQTSLRFPHSKEAFRLALDG